MKRKYLNFIFVHLCRVDIKTFNPATGGIDLDARIYGKDVCRQLFLDILCLPDNE